MRSTKPPLITGCYLTARDSDPRIQARKDATQAASKHDLAWYVWDGLMEGQRVQVLSREMLR